MDRVDIADGDCLEVARYGTTPEQKHIRSRAETCRVTILEISPCPELLVEKSEEAFQISLRSKRAYMKSTGLTDRPVAFILESWPTSSTAFVFFCPSVDIAQTWIEKLRIAGCIMSDWRKKCKTLEVVSKRKGTAGTAPEMIRAIIKPKEKRMPAKEVVMKVAQVDQADETLDDAHRLAQLNWQHGKKIGGTNGLYEVVMNGSRTLVLIMDTSTAWYVENARLSQAGSDSPRSPATLTPEYSPSEMLAGHPGWISEFLGEPRSGNPANSPVLHPIAE
jgi:hypothetical protein